MILGEIYKKEELNTFNLDGIIINISSFSSPTFSSFSIDDAKEIIKTSTKPVFVKLMPLYKDKDYPRLKELLLNLKGIKGIIFQDLGLATLKKELNLDYKMIYDPTTFITTSYDTSYFKGSGVDTLSLSTTLTMSETDNLLKDKDNSYMAHVYGYQEMFYSYRKHFTNYSKVYNFKDLKNKDNISLKEETRDALFKTLEDDYGFYVYRDKKINLFDFIDHYKDIDYMVLDRIFISDNEYKDTIDLFKGIIKRDDYIKKYPEKFDTGFLFKQVGLLYGDVS